MKQSAVKKPDKPIGQPYSLSFWTGFAVGVAKLHLKPHHANVPNPSRVFRALCYEYLQEIFKIFQNWGMSKQYQTILTRNMHLLSPQNFERAHVQPWHLTDKWRCSPRTGSSTPTGRPILNSRLGCKMRDPMTSRLIYRISHILRYYVTCHNMSTIFYNIPPYSTSLFYNIL